MIRKLIGLVFLGGIMFLFCGGVLAVVSGTPRTPEQLAEDARVDARRDELRVQDAKRSEVAAAEEASRPQMNAANYARVKNGMGYAEVIAIVGRPTSELSRSEIGGIETVMYEWSVGYLGSNANMTFQNGELVQKAQFGL